METFDLLVFCYDGNNNTARIIQNIDERATTSSLEDLQNTGMDIHGCIQLSREQTHYRDTNVMAPKKFLVWIDANTVKFLHDIEVFVPRKEAEAAIQSMEREAESHIGDPFPVEDVGAPIGSAGDENPALEAPHPDSEIEAAQEDMGGDADHDQDPE